MIAKLAKGRGFRGAANYLMHGSDRGSDRGHVIGGNLSGSTPKEWSREIAAFRRLRPTLGKAVFHASLSLPPTERFVSDTEFAEIGERFLNGMGFSDAPFVIVRHSDTEHAHIHILACRITPAGKVVSDQNDCRKAIALSHQLAKDFGLTPVVPANKKKQENATMETAKLNQIEASLINPADDAAIPEADVPGIEPGGDEAKPKRRREYKRQLLEQLYQQTLTNLFLARIQYISGKGIPLSLKMKDGGRIADHGDKVLAYGLSAAPAAEMLIEMALLKRWPVIVLRGPDDFLRQAMALAIAKGLSVQFVDSHQLAIWNEVKQDCAASSAAVQTVTHQRINEPAKLHERLAALRNANNGDDSAPQPRRFGFRKP